MSDQFPVFVDVRGERVRIGTATREADGFVLKLSDFYVGSAPVRSAPSAGASSGGAGGGGSNEVFPNYGRSKGMPIRGASMQDLEFYINGSRRSLADPAKARFHDREKVLLAAMEAELARQQGGSPSDDGPPPPGDDDAPF